MTTRETLAAGIAKALVERSAATLDARLRPIEAKLAEQPGAIEATVDIRSAPTPPRYLLTVQRNEITGLIESVLMEPLP